MTDVDSTPFAAIGSGGDSACALASRGSPATAASDANSDAIMEGALAATTIYSESQKQNVRWMARDLAERRSTWTSVPFRILFEFNRRCNVQCVHCGIARKGTGELSPEVLERLLDDIGWGAVEIMPFLGGEPTLAPLGEAAALVRRHGQWLNLITNGVRFDRRCFEEIADVTARVQYSFHSHRPEVFHRIIPTADFARVARNLEDGVRIAERTDAHIVACIVPMFDMLEHLADYVRFVARLGVRRVIVQNPYPHTPGLEKLQAAEPLDPARAADCYAETLATAKELGVFVETNVAPLFGDPENVPSRRSRFDILQDNAHVVALYCPQFCISTALQLVVEWDGTVLPCIRDRIVIGNILEQDFESIWNGPAMRRLRESHFARKPRPNCARCRVFYLDHP